MQIIKHTGRLKLVLSRYRKQGATIGFIPTMGALHPGHLSLIKQSVITDDITVSSIYVNPTQFDDKSDLKNYPRNFKSDYALLKSEECTIVFSPDNKEMYPRPDNRRFNFGRMGDVMEGKMRPGHFNGVAQIVTKLFDAVQPHRAYFGKKDFQQLAIIQKLVNDYDIEIVACPIIREKDRLAMSSRNSLLSDQERNDAPAIYRTLLLVKEKFRNRNVKEAEKFVEERINKYTSLKLEYFQIVNSITLDPVDEIASTIPLTACIAVYAGSVRLIDNIDIFS
ncbi:Pantothenate synthetase [subsurface metagenome]